jgi:quinol monooxygenase YgiN
MLHVIATIDLKPGMREAFLKEFAVLMPKVRAEKGCLQYEPSIDVATGLAAQPTVRPDSVVVIEKWADLGALHAHMNAPHMAEYRGKVKDILVGLTLHVTQPA